MSDQALIVRIIRGAAKRRESADAAKRQATVDVPGEAGAELVFKAHDRLFRPREIKAAILKAQSILTWIEPDFDSL